jgi:voltage-gated potassium channel Kch
LSIEKLIGLGIVGLCAALVFLFSVLKKPGGSLRGIPAVNRLRRGIGLAVEDGKRLHVSLGKASILSPHGASALVGLSVLERLAEVSTVSDKPPVATSGEGTLALLSQDSLRSVYRESNQLEQYNRDLGRLAGPTDFSYVAGSLPVIKREDVYTNVLIGNFGPEVGLMCEAIDRADGFSLAASDSLPAQAVLYATAQEPLIGEELFALPAYLQSGKMHLASVRAQDVVRAVVIGVLVLGSAARLVLTFLGINF